MGFRVCFGLGIGKAYTMILLLGGRFIESGFPLQYEHVQFSQSTNTTDSWALLLVNVYVQQDEVLAQGGLPKVRAQ